MSPVHAPAYKRTSRGAAARTLIQALGWSRRDVTAVAGAGLLVAVTTLGLWLASGVRVDEIARFVPYELGFVILPGWLVYRACMIPAGGGLRQIVFGWSLGYLLEVLAFFVTATTGTRSLFVVYPLVVGIPAALIVWRRTRPLAGKAGLLASTRPSISTICGVALICSLVLVYAGAVGFSQTPLPREISSATYQEDTVFTISIAAEALHHWPVTLPMVSGQPLHYHLFAFMHMAAISQVTGIDLSVVVMRLYTVPLLLLFVLQLVLAGRRLRRGPLLGLVTAVLVLFCGELDIATSSSGGLFLFGDFFFYWLVASHTFLFGLIFFVPLIVILCDLVTSPGMPRRRQLGSWSLVALFLVGCVGAKSYSVSVLVGGLALFLLVQFWRERKVNLSALLALALTTGSYAAANFLVFKWSAGGQRIDPLVGVTHARGVDELGGYLHGVWGIQHVPTVLQVGYGVFGLLGVALLGIGLRLGYRKLPLSTAEVWFVSLFAMSLPPLLLLAQPGLGQLFLVFFALVPGAIVAAHGFTLFWQRQSRRSLRLALFTFAVAVGVVIGMDSLLRAMPRVGLLVTLFWLVLLAAGATLAPAVSRRSVVMGAAALGFLGLIAIDTPLIRLLRSAWGRGTVDGRTLAIPTWAAWFLTVIVVAALALATVYFVRRRSSVQGLTASVVAGCLVLGLLNTPLDWFPHLVKRAAAGKPVYNQELMGLTSGLYSGLLWIREHTPTNAVLAVNNHSLHFDNRDSKYFYYSAFAQRRVVLESWDYTAQAAASGLFSLDTAHTPFLHRLTLSDLAFGTSDENAIRALAREYGADYLVVDKVHRSAPPLRARNVRGVFSNGDMDIYAIVAPGSTRSTGSPPATAQPPCTSHQGSGIVAVFGHRRTLSEAIFLRRSAQAVGFPGLLIQRRGCLNYAVVLTGLQSLAQAEEFQREAANVAFQVQLECRTFAPTGGVNAVFGHRRTERAAKRLAAEARAAGFQGLDVQQDSCRDWEVDLKGLETAAQRREFRREAARVGFHIVYEPG